MPKGVKGFQKGNTLRAGASNPRGRFITARLISMMHEEETYMDLDPADPKQVKMIKMRTTRLVRFCNMLMRMACNGDLQAIKYICDRIEGVPIQTTVMVEDFDPEKIEAERKRLETQREKLKNMTDDERTQLYFETLSKASRVGGSSASRH